MSDFYAKRSQVFFFRLDRHLSNVEYIIMTQIGF